MSSSYPSDDWGPKVVMQVLTLRVAPSFISAEDRHVWLELGWTKVTRFKGPQTGWLSICTKGCERSLTPLVDDDTPNGLPMWRRW